MDSLTLYQHFCSNDDSRKAEEKYAQVDRMIECIYSEVFAPPFETSRSPFLCEAVKMMNQRKEQKNSTLAGAFALSVFDVYVILSGLKEYIQNASYRTTAVQGDISEYLFYQGKVWGTWERSEEKIAEYMREIHALAEEAKAGQSKEQGMKKEMDQSVKRREMQKDDIRQWHQKQEEMRAELQRMQPDVRSLLEGFLSFQDTVKENYVLQFARLQIELYDLIADAFAYHKERAKESRDEDYQNAADNYEEYMEMIVDGLASFGVEEIVSAPQAAFEGGIHETDAVHFSAKDAVVTGSVRSGFRYGELVLQKEKVIL